MERLGAPPWTAVRLARLFLFLALASTFFLDYTILKATGPSSVAIDSPSPLASVGLPCRRSRTFSFGELAVRQDTSRFRTVLIPSL